MRMASIRRACRLLASINSRTLQPDMGTNICTQTSQVMGSLTLNKDLQLIRMGRLMLHT